MGFWSLQGHLHSSPHLDGSCSLGVKAVAHQHEERVAHAAEDLHGFRVRHSQQALVIHLQDPHPHLQAAVPGCSPRGAHLEHTGESLEQVRGDGRAWGHGGEGADSTHR